MEDPALVRRLASERIPLTVCPTSNVVIANRYRSLAEHPLPAMRDAGLLVTINTDDPAMQDLDLGLEYRRVGEAHGLTRRRDGAAGGRGDRVDLAGRVGSGGAAAGVRGGSRGSVSRGPACSED